MQGCMHVHRPLHNLHVLDLYAVLSSGLDVEHGVHRFMQNLDLLSQCRTHAASPRWCTLLPLFL